MCLNMPCPNSTPTTRPSSGTQAHTHTHVKTGGAWLGWARGARAYLKDIPLSVDLAAVDLVEHLRCDPHRQNRIASAPRGSTRLPPPALCARPLLFATKPLWRRGGVQNRGRRNLVIEQGVTRLEEDEDIEDDGVMLRGLLVAVRLPSPGVNAEPHFTDCRECHHSPSGATHSPILEQTQCRPWAGNHYLCTIIGSSGFNGWAHEVIHVV